MSGVSFGRRFGLRALLSVLVVVALAVLSLQGSALAQRDHLRIVETSRLGNLDPAFATLGEEILLVRNIFSGLLKYKYNSTELEGDLATHWDVSEDGRTYTFYLRDDATFHRGYGPVTAHDVKFSFDRILDPATGTGWRSEFALLEKVEVVDDYTVRLHLSKPAPGFLHRLIGVRQGAIVSQKALEDLGDDYSRMPVGSGPYQVESAELGREVVLVAHEGYHGGVPAIKRVTWMLAPDPDAALLAVEAGQADLRWQIARDERLFRALEDAGLAVKETNRLAWMMLHMDNSAEPFNDVRVRRAIAHAIDREAIVQYVYAGVGEVLNSLVPQGFWAHTEEGMPVYDYDPDKARQLLQEAGWGNGFRVTLDTFESTNYLPVALAVQDMLGQVGIDVHIEITDITTWLEKVSSAQTDFTLYLPTRSPDPDIVLTQFYHSSSFSPGLNLPRYSALDAEIEAARSELDDERRMAIYHQIQRRLMEDLPSIPIAMVGYVSAYNPALKGIPELEAVWGFDFTELWFE